MAEDNPDLPWEVAYPLPECGKARLVPEKEAQELFKARNILSNLVYAFREDDGAAADLAVYEYYQLFPDIPKLDFLDGEE